MPSAPPSPKLTDDDLRTLEAILRKLSGPGADLPWPLFRFMTEVMATANVDLLVRDPARGVLLAWRADPFGAGWHVPGSIIRHREEIAHRLAETAREEFACALDVQDRVAAVIQIFDDRGHSVSLVYPATLDGAPGRRVVGEADTPEPGDLRWFVKMPEDMYPSHLVYREVVASLAGGEGAGVFTQHVGRRDAAQTEAGGVIAAPPGTLA